MIEQLKYLAKNPDLIGCKDPERCLEGCRENIEVVDVIDKSLFDNENFCIELIKLDPSMFTRCSKDYETIYQAFIDNMTSDSISIVHDSQIKFTEPMLLKAIEISQNPYRLMRYQSVITDWTQLIEDYPYLLAKTPYLPDYVYQAVLPKLEGDIMEIAHEYEPMIPYLGLSDQELIELSNKYLSALLHVTPTPETIPLIAEINPSVIKGVTDPDVIERAVLVNRECLA